MGVEPSPEQFEFSHDNEAKELKEKRFSLAWLEKLRRRRIIVPEVALALDDNSPEMTPDHMPDTLPNTPETIKTSKVLEKVVEAAEKGVPIEKEYELRHEVKDRAEKALGAEAVGTILAKKTSPLPEENAPKAHQKMAKPATESIAANNLQPAPSLYRRAIKFGFLTALAIILTAILYTILTTISI